jgi:type II secretory pathway pseudopilin PulG
LKQNSLKNQSGQTLIETIVAIFILTMALISGLSLAIFASQASTDSRDKIIATNLAREGLEVVRMLRDTNWLSAQDLASVDDLFETNGGCSFGGGSANNRPCYPEAFDEPYDIQTSNTLQNYRVVFNPSSPTGTGFDWDILNGSENYLLCVWDDGSYRHNLPNGTGCTPDVGRFARRITVARGNISSPYTSDSNSPDSGSGHSPEKIITSVVVWQGRGCAPWPASILNLNPVTFSTKCKVILEERLTNWKDYK